MINYFQKKIKNTESTYLAACVRLTTEPKVSENMRLRGVQRAVPVTLVLCHLVLVDHHGGPGFLYMRNFTGKVCISSLIYVRSNASSTTRD